MKYCLNQKISLFFILFGFIVHLSFSNTIVVGANLVDSEFLRSIAHQQKNRQQGQPQGQHGPMLTKPPQEQAKNLKTQSQKVSNQPKLNAQDKLYIIPQSLDPPESLSFRLRQKFRQKTPQSKPDTDMYDFGMSVQKMMTVSDIKKNFGNGTKYYEYIDINQYKRAIRLTEVVHNVDFRGDFELDHFNFYQSAQSKFKALWTVLKQEKDYFNAKYQMDKYIHNQIRFCVVVPSYNNAKKTRLYLRNLDSIFQQEYKNYHLVYFNDASTDGTGEYVKDYMQVNGIPSEKYKIINNQQKLGSGPNIYDAAHNYCKLGEVMILVDGDDSLIGRQVFSLLNAIYQTKKVALTYGQSLQVYPHRSKNGYGSPISQHWDQRTTKQLYAGHLKTLYVDLYRHIRKQDLQHANGKWIQLQTDVAFMIPACEMAGKRQTYVGQIIYERRLSTGLNEVVDTIWGARDEICAKPAYLPLDNLSFADDPITNYFP